MVAHKQDLRAYEERLARVESRLVQLMLHLGLDPYNKVYEADHIEQMNTQRVPRKPNR